MNKLDKSFITNVNRYFKMIRNTTAVTIILLAIAFAGTTTLLAQSSYNRGYAESTEFRIAMMEQAYDAHVINVVSQYFNPATFYVSSTIETNLIDAKEPVSGVQVVLNYPDNITLPGLPYLPEGILNRDVEQNITTTNILAQNAYKLLKLERLLINIYADSEYSQEELDFLAEIASTAVKAKAQRGDVVNIERVDIPTIRTFKNEGYDYTMYQLNTYKTVIVVLSTALLIIFIIFLYKIMIMNEEKEVLEEEGEEETEEDAAEVETDADTEEESDN